MTASMTGPGERTLGVLLAGGQSRRMDRPDKCLILLAGRPILAHAIERLRPQVSTLILNANGDPERFRRFGLTVVPDPMPGYLGPLAGILAGMLWARDNLTQIRYIATAATDTPFFPYDLVDRLSGGLTENVDIAIASSGGRDHPVFGLFRVDLAEELATYLDRGEDRAARAWVDRQKFVRVDFASQQECKSDPFFNINTPADFAAAETRLRGHNARTSIE